MPLKQGSLKESFFEEWVPDQIGIIFLPCCLDEDFLFPFLSVHITTVCHPVLIQMTHRCLAWFLDVTMPPSFALEMTTLPVSAFQTSIHGPAQLSMLLCLPLLLHLSASLLVPPYVTSPFSSCLCFTLDVMPAISYLLHFTSQWRMSCFQPATVH